MYPHNKQWHALLYVLSAPLLDCVDNAMVCAASSCFGSLSSGGPFSVGPRPSPAPETTENAQLVVSGRNHFACLLVVQVWVDDDERDESLAMVVRTGMHSCPPYMLTL